MITSGSRRRTGAAGELSDDRYVGSSDLTRWRSRPGRVLANLVHAVSQRLGAHAALVVILVIGGAVAASVTAGFAWIYDSVADQDGLAGLDHPVLAEAIRLRTPLLDTVITGYTDIGGTTVMPVLATGIAVFLTLWRRAVTPIVLMIAAGGGSLLMTIAGKQLFGRSRPPLSDAVPPYEHSPSFPSGHTLNATVIAGIIAYLLILRQHRAVSRAITVAAAGLFAMTIGLSRVFLGHHWLTDVAAGWLLGIGWLAVVITAHRLYLTARARGAPTNPAQEPPGPPRDIE